jgi:hypothetical protein
MQLDGDSRRDVGQSRRFVMQQSQPCPLVLGERDGSPRSGNVSARDARSIANSKPTLGTSTARHPFDLLGVSVIRRSISGNSNARNCSDGLFNSRRSDSVTGRWTCILNIEG